MTESGFVDGILKADVVGCVIDNNQTADFAEVIAQGQAGAMRFHAVHFRVAGPQTEPRKCGFAVPMAQIAPLGPVVTFTTASGARLRNGIVEPGPVPAAPQPPFDPQYIFLHLPKTAGTAVANALRAAMPQSAFASIYPTQAWLSQQEFQALHSHQRDAVRIAFGHLYFRSLINPLLRNPRYLTFLREPLSRIKSHYWMLRRMVAEPTHAGIPVRHSEIVNLALTDDFDNLQTRMIAGTPTRIVPLGQMSNQIIGRALYNIEHSFDFVGFSETADADFLQLCRILNLEPAKLPRSNENTSLDDADDDFLRLDWDMITYRNRFDIALFDMLINKNPSPQPRGAPS